MTKKDQSTQAILTNSIPLQTMLEKANSLTKLRALLSTTIPLELQSQCQLANYRDGVLIMHVTASVWSTRLRLLWPQLEKQIRRLAEFSDLKQIEIKVRPTTTTTKEPVNSPRLSASGKAALAAAQEILGKN